MAVPKQLRKRFESLKEDFRLGSTRWPGLHHAFIQQDIDGIGELNFFINTWPSAVVAPLAGQRMVLESVPSLQAALVSERMGFTIYFDEVPGNLDGLNRFRDLALTASRCFFPKMTAQWSNAYGHSSFLPDMWLCQVYMLAHKHCDPLLTVREHRVEVSGDGSELRLTPGYSTKIPEGIATGLAGRRRPWSDLLSDLARCGVCVYVLEPDVFRASAYVLENIISSNWRVGTSSRGRVGRAKNPRVADRDEATIEEYERHPDQSFQAIADKIAPEFSDVKCGVDQVRKAIKMHTSQKTGTGKK